MDSRPTPHAADGERSCWRSASRAVAEVWHVIEHKSAALAAARAMGSTIVRTERNKA